MGCRFIQQILTLDPLRNLKTKCGATMLCVLIVLLRILLLLGMYKSRPLFFLFCHFCSVLHHFYKAPWHIGLGAQPHAPTSSLNLSTSVLSHLLTVVPSSALCNKQWVPVMALWLMTIHDSSKWLSAVCFGANRTFVTSLSFHFQVFYFLQEIFKRNKATYYFYNKAQTNHN